MAIALAALALGNFSSTMLTTCTICKHITHKRCTSHHVHLLHSVPTNMASKSIFTYLHSYYTKQSWTVCWSVGWMACGLLACAPLHWIHMFKYWMNSHHRVIRFFFRFAKQICLIFGTLRSYSALKMEAEICICSEIILIKIWNLCPSDLNIELNLPRLFSTFCSSLVDFDLMLLVMHDICPTVRILLLQHCICIVQLYRDLEQKTNQLWNP